MFAIGDEEWAGLSKLLEEAGEVIQVGGKLMGSRGATNHWSGNLREKFIEECGDLMAALTFFMAQNFDQKTTEIMMDRAEDKLELFFKWHNENPELPKDNNV